MAAHLSRRELLAWLSAGTGAAIAGGSVLSNRNSETGSAGTGTRAEPDAGAREPSSSDARNVIGKPSGQPTGSSLERMLVVLEMPGGNDSLSMVVPYGIGSYYDRRSETAISEADVLRLDDEVGLHPNLVNLHRRGITLVDGLGATQPDGSHFEMQARWWAGDSKAGPSQTGWVGRVADHLASDSIPAAAISVGSGSHPIARSMTGSTLSMPGADAVWALAGAEPDDVIRRTYQRALRSFAAGDSAHATTLKRTMDFAEVIVALDSDVDRDALGYEESGLASSLGFAAMLLAGGTGVRVVHVSMNGDFDTHEGHTWKHPELMRDLDTNLEAFHKDLDQRGIGDRVMVMTTSEFGRTLNENGSGGLDHGTAATAFLSGPGTGGRLGEMPSLTKLDDNDDLRATVPFESYLGGVVQGWLDIPADEIFPGSDPMELVG